jgi:hypothetical protein
MNAILHIKLGFKIDDVCFGWHDGVLYQLPYTNSGRFFGLRVLRNKVSKKGWTYYHIRRKKYGLEKIKAILQEVDWEVRKPIEII